MTEPSPSVVADVKGFCERHQADPASVEATGVRVLFDEPDIEEIDAALDELAARRDGTRPDRVIDRWRFTSRDDSSNTIATLLPCPVPVEKDSFRTLSMEWTQR